MSMVSTKMPGRQPGASAADSVEPKAPFLIVTTSSARLDPAVRKQVRSYVMRGKNRKKHKPHDNAALGSWINGSQDIAPDSDPARAAIQAIPPRVGNDLTHITFADEMQPDMLELVFKCACSHVPSRISGPLVECSLMPVSLDRSETSHPPG